MYRLQKAGHKQARPLDEKAAPAARPHGSLLDDLVDEDEVFERTVLKEHLEPKPAAAIAEPTPAEKPTRPASPSNSLAATLPGLKYIDRIGVDEVLGWLRAGIVWIVLAIILCVAAALAYAYMTPPRYTAYTDIVVNPSNLNVVSDGVFSPNQQRDTQILEVESKLRTVTSRNVLARVVDELKLDEDPEFISPPPLARLKAFFSPKPEDGDNKVGALRSLGERVAAERDPRSFVVTLAVWTNDPDKSVTVSKAMVKAFESELFQTTSDSSLRIVDDLKKRLEEMRQNVTIAEKRVADFRRENGLQENNGQSGQQSGVRRAECAGSCRAAARHSGGVAPQADAGGDCPEPHPERRDLRQPDHEHHPCAIQHLAAADRGDDADLWCPPSASGDGGGGTRHAGTRHCG